MATKRVFSGIQPTGSIHLGNYLGAIKNWAAIQGQYDCIYCVVDYHAITSLYDPKTLRAKSLDLAADLIACGIDPDRSILFVQSHVPEHTELCWVFNSVTAYGDLTRMTQFKDKSQRAAETGDGFINAGLFNYPILQAADIALYEAHYVPVGKDQQQHVELSREIVRKFNASYGDLLVEPGALLTEGADIRSLADPECKMSKSYGDKHVVGLMEPEAGIEKKFKRAVTDTGLEEASADMSPGVANLFTILRLTRPESADRLLAAYRDKSLLYSELKGEVFGAVMDTLAPIRARKAELANDPGQLAAILAEGARKARAIAEQTMDKVRSHVGVGRA